jgi:hypothetical protein
MHLEEVIVVIMATNPRGADMDRRDSRNDGEF